MNRTEAMALVRARQLDKVAEARTNLVTARFVADAAGAYLRENDGVQIDRSEMFRAFELIQRELEAALEAVEVVLR